MAPKKNKQRERQEMTKASSSARAQEQLLASFGGAPAAPSGFIGFGSFAASAATHSAAAPSAGTTSSKGSFDGKNGIVQTIYDGADQDITLALKMLGKKGSVTKIKALNSFLAEILPPKKPLEIRSMLGPFVQLYTYEVRDQNDRKVRQLINEVLCVLCSKLKPKAFAPHLKRLLPYWLLAMHDVNNDAAAQANRAFEALFPEREARLEVVDEYLNAIMEEFQSFFGKTADNFDGVPLEVDEREERYERCVSAAASSLHTIVTLFADLDQVDKLSDENASFSLASVVSSDKFGRLATSSSKHPSFSRDVVRKATYKALFAVIMRAPAIIQAREEAFGKIILGVLGDKFPGNHEDMWNTVLNFLQNFPSVWKASSSFPKFATSVMYPRLFSLIRHGFHGSSRISFPTLLPLISLIPLDAIGDRSKGGECALYTGVVEQCLKFLESDASRFNERYAINAFFECLTAYFSIFLDSEESVAWLSEIPEDQLVAKYVGQFEKVVKAALSLVFTSSSSGASFALNHVELFVSSLLTMMARLTNFTAKKATSEAASAVKTAFLQKLHQWIREVVLNATSKLSVEAAHVNLLVKSGVMEAEAKFLSSEASEWKTTATLVYSASLAQLLGLSAGLSEIPIDSASAVGKLLTLMNGVYQTIGLAATLDTEETADSHFEAQIRVIVQSASQWDKKDASVKQTKRVILEVCRHFFVAVSDKKSFLLQLFKDFGVQYGDMSDATDIIKYALEFPISQEGAQRWLSSGSWKDTSAAAIAPATTETLTPELQALTAIWEGKLLDEFLMISLKGRLDDLDADAFAALLTASLGGETNFPVVSPDAVVILCHFALQSGPETTDVLMRILPNLLHLFAKISTTSGDGEASNNVLPRELAAVEQKLYLRLFYLAARGAFRIEASALWEATALNTMKRWSEASKLEFVDTLAGEINALLVAKSEGDAPFNTNQLSAFAKKFLLLGDTQDALFPTQALAQKLDFVRLRCAQDVETHAMFFDRLLPVLGEICDSERHAELLGAYYAQLYTENESETVELVGNLVDVDVVHSLTWFVFHSDNDGNGRLLDSRVEILHNYLTLEHLYDVLKKNAPVLLSRVLEQVVSDKRATAAAGKAHRDLIFVNKNGEDAATGALTPGNESDALMATQSEDLDSLVVATLASYVSASNKAALIQKLLDESFEWASRDGLVVVQPLVVSLMKDNTWMVAASDADNSNAAQILESFCAFIKKLASSAASNARYYFQFVRLAGACWRHVGDENEALKELFQEAAYRSILTRMESVLRPGAYASVETSEWILLTEFLSALPLWRVRASPEDQEKWESVAKMAITHVIAGKQEVAMITALKLHKRSGVMRDGALEDEQFVFKYPHELIRARLAMLSLLRAIDSVNQGQSLRELSSSYRETLLSIVLCALSEGIELKAHLVTTYMSTTSAQKSYDLIQLSLAVEEALVHVLHALYVTLGSVEDVDHAKEFVLESFGGVEGLATLFDAEKYPMNPKLRALLYILASHSGALKLRAFDQNTIDINADDEAATEAALAKSVIPKAVRKALELEFSSVQKVEMKRRKQKPVEREDIMGRLLLWDLFLQLFPASAAASNTPTMVASALSSYAAQHGLLSNFLTFCSTLLAQESALSRTNGKLALQDTPLFRLDDLETGLATWTNDKTSVFHLGARVFFRTVIRLPAMVRTWWNDECSRSLRSWAAKYFEEHITPFILSSELDIIQSASQTHSWDAHEMAVKGSRVSREITTTYVKDECALEMVIRVPASYPLRSVEVECTKRIGISEDRWRRWVLQIIKVTASQDGSLLDAVLLWKKNVDKEFEGVEPCPICYSILNPKTMGLPNLPCKTCSNKYHNSCLYKWFNQSGKNKCPICQQPFH